MDRQSGYQGVISGEGFGSLNHANAPFLKNTQFQSFIFHWIHRNRMWHSVTTEANEMGSIKKQEQDPLAAYRDRIIYPILITGAICLAPLFINSFIEKRFGGGLATLIVAVLFVVDAIALRAGKRPPVPYALLLLPMALAMGVSLVTQGFYGALWAYPVAIACFFVLSQRIANLSAVLLLVSGGVLVYRFVDLGMALRFTRRIQPVVATLDC
jgi:hypothetical protein